jgi:hypothetical protein
MYRFRVLIILSIAWLLAILNLERIVGGTPLQSLSIQPFVYILVFITIIVHIIVLKSSIWSYTLGNMVVLLTYGVGRVLMFKGNFDFQNILPSLVLELFILLTTYWLVRELASWFYSYSGMLKQAIFNPINTLVRNTYHDESMIEQKIALARRFDRQLTLLYVQLEEDVQESSVLWDNLKEIRLATLQLRLAELLGFLAGETAVKTWHHGNLVICMQSDKKQVNTTISQLQDVITDVMKMNVEVGIATFPKDGLLFDDLVEKARERISIPVHLQQGLPQTRRLQMLDLDTRPPKHGSYSTE